MRQVPNEQLQDRRKVIRACNHAAKQDVSFDSKALSDQIEAGDDTQTRYQKLRDHARDMFLAGEIGKTPHIEGSSRSGFDILTELLSIAPNEYLQYCEERHAVPYLKEINNALKRSQETPRRLMGMPSYTNSEAEAGFGLRTGFGPAQYTPLRFEPTGIGPLFIIDDDIFASYSKPRYDTGLPEYLQRCPAMRVVLERVWPAMVDLATDTPEIFAHDLDMLDTGRDV